MDDYEVNKLLIPDIEISAIKFVAKYSRDTLYSNDMLFQPLDLEYISEDGLFLECRYRVVPVKKFEKNIEAQTIFSDRIVELLETDWSRLGIAGRHRFTAAHEVGHVVLHRKQLGNIPVAAARRKDNKEIPMVNRAEWQADTFASAALMPYPSIAPLIKDLRLNNYSKKEIAKIICTKYKVSSQAAFIRIDKIDYINMKGYDITIMKKGAAFMKNTTP